MTVNLDSFSADVSWSSFPLSDPTDYFALRYTQDNVSVMSRVGEHDSSYRMEKLLLPSRFYVIDVVTFTEHKIYSSQNVSVKTEEGGKLEYSLYIFFVFVGVLCILYVM